jgi:hypothetical protein
VSKWARPGPYPEKLVPICTNTTSSYSAHVSPSWSLTWETCTHLHSYHLFIQCSREPVLVPILRNLYPFALTTSLHTVLTWAGPGPYPEELVPICTDTISSYSAHVSPSWSLSSDTCTHLHWHHLFIQCSRQPVLVSILRNLYPFALTPTLHTVLTWARPGPYPEKLVPICTDTISSYSAHVSPSWSQSWETCTHLHWHHLFIVCSRKPVLVPILRHLYPFALTPSLHTVLTWARPGPYPEKLVPIREDLSLLPETYKLTRLFCIMRSNWYTTYGSYEVTNTGHHHNKKQSILKLLFSEFLYISTGLFAVFRISVMF